MKVLLGLLAFLAVLVVFGLAGESDRRTALDAELLRGEIVATAPAWAVTR